MYEKFLKIEKEKQERIINAALEEFSINGYQKASTNNIVKKAEISKGLLFHYFKNKKGLFLYLFHHFTDMIVEEIYGSIDLNQTDLFVRLKKATEEKMRMINKYPTSFAFLEKAFVEKEMEVNLEINKKYQDLIKRTSQLFRNIDYTKFKIGIDINKAIKIITWTLDGMGNEMIEEAKQSKQPIDYKQTYLKVEDYFQFFQQLFYKEEELL